MKASTIFVSALAAVVSAAPAAPAAATTELETRSSFDLNLLNNLAFSNNNFQYLNIVNSFDLQLLAQLGSVNNFNILGFQNLFQSNTFNINDILQFQQLAVVLQLAQLGVFNGFDLSSLALNQFNFGLIGGVGGFDISSLIDQSLFPQINQVIQAGVVINKE